mmetsp:Transcript_73378/g.130152  ORF Transcript_73378/g.130152 Transcript_73378/m.130152 type:complete len:411 (-) Transcript_73378:93-1325(-)
MHLLPLLVLGLHLVPTFQTRLDINHAASEQKINLRHETGWFQHHYNTLYYVFVRRAAINGFSNGSSGYHTEVVWCEPAEANDAQLEEQLSMTYYKLNKVEVPQGNLSAWNPYFPNCLISGHPWASSLSADGDLTTKEMYFYPDGKTIKNHTSFYVGTVDFSKFWNERGTNYILTDNWESYGRYDPFLALSYFIKEMQSCGNWEEDDYQWQTNNCNHYTETLMKAMRFDFQVKHHWAEYQITENGWFDVTGDLKCHGVKCGKDNCNFGGTCKRLKKDVNPKCYRSPGSKKSEGQTVEQTRCVLGANDGGATGCVIAASEGIVTSETGVLKHVRSRVDCDHAVEKASMSCGVLCQKCKKRRFCHDTKQPVPKLLRQQQQGVCEVTYSGGATASATASATPDDQTSGALLLPA